MLAAIALAGQLFAPDVIGSKVDQTVVCAPLKECAYMNVTRFVPKPWKCAYMNVHGGFYGGGPLLVVPERWGIPTDPRARIVNIAWINPLDEPVVVRVGFFASMDCFGQ